MNKKIDIEKKIDFSKSISEVTAISLEHDLKFIDSESINGNLIISGKYKTTLAAEKDEVFNYKIPVEITLTDSLDTNTSNINIIDFIYNVVDDKSLLCKIELAVDGNIIENNREYDGDPIDQKEIELPKIDDKKVETEILDADVVEEEKIVDDKSKKNVVDEERDDVDNDEVEEDALEEQLFNIDNSKETFGTFIVYMVRQNETINSIISKYNTSLEEIEKYNDIKDLSIGSKLIIPLLKNESK